MTKTDEGLKILWTDNHKSYFHYIWLRDSCMCPSCYHSEAEEKLLDLVSVPVSLKPLSLSLTKEGNLEVVWNDGNNHKSTFDTEFLRKHSTASSVLPEDYFIWGRHDLKRLPEIPYSEVINKDEAVLDWLNKLMKFGFVIIKDAPKQQGISKQLAKLVNFPRQTFWGEDWSVKNTPNPENLSLTSLELKCHTDFVWSEYTPGVQFLHCLKSAGNMGGESVLVDGFKVAEVLREQDPNAFNLLSTYPVPWYFRTKKFDYTFRGCVIELDKNGNVKSLRYNQANRLPLDGPTQLIPDMYRALRKFAELIRSTNLTQTFLLQPGDVLVFNNRRLLHGRTAFDSRAERYLEGCYLDLEEVMCRRTILANYLSRNFSEPTFTSDTITTPMDVSPIYTPTTSFESNATSSTQ